MLKADGIYSVSFCIILHIVIWWLIEMTSWFLHKGYEIQLLIQERICISRKILVTYTCLFNYTSYGILTFRYAVESEQSFLSIEMNLTFLRTRIDFDNYIKKEIIRKLMKDHSKGNISLKAEFIYFLHYPCPRNDWLWLSLMIKLAAR